MLPEASTTSSTPRFEMEMAGWPSRSARIFSSAQPGERTVTRTVCCFSRPSNAVAVATIRFSPSSSGTCAE